MTLIHHTRTSSHQQYTILEMSVRNIWG